MLNTGHVHPKVQAAIAAQLQRFTHSCYQGCRTLSMNRLRGRINAIAPIDGAKKTAFFSTGAEAVENAIKMRAPIPSAVVSSRLAGISWP